MIFTIRTFSQSNFQEHALYALSRNWSSITLELVLMELIAQVKRTMPSVILKCVN